MMRASRLRCPYHAYELGTIAESEGKRREAFRFYMRSIELSQAITATRRWARRAAK